MSFRKFLSRIESFLFPWPSHLDRKEAVREAKEEKEQSERSQQRARHVEQQIRRMMEDNHFAENIARQLVDRGRRYQ